jgi:glycogen debranching enzyme
MIQKLINIAAEYHEAKAQEIKAQTFKWLWRADLEHFCAFNTKTMKSVTNRTFLMAFPLWDREFMQGHEEKVLLVMNQVKSDDMMCPFGIRSTSSLDPRFNNEVRNCTMLICYRHCACDV